ncbi:hypothetical protein Goari_001756 [Gossypium aridum]|uniref:Glycoside hydrolase family 3 N-terminal domain-containing protein n=1 Tax=Gossypium aridum TaxID=34290 RepID=A0A7J8YMK2_GOSAI|nr:hypothetical protein [Gossypium aridum]
MDCTYKNPNAPIEVRVKDLLSRMTLQEKIGQMTQIERSVATPADLKSFSIGSILSAGGSVPFQKALPADWADMVDKFQQAALESRLGIPLIYGIDAVHGNNSVYGATIFPHNVGLGATSQLRGWTRAHENWTPKSSVVQINGFPLACDNLVFLNISLKLPKSLVLLDLKCEC